MNLQEVRVLFVEDSENDVELALRALKREGLRVVSCRVESESGMREALGSFHADLILSDFSMPNFDGLKALRLAQNLAPDVPFLFVSGTIGEERAIEAIRMGATDYVLKDNTRRLGSSVKRALAESQERELARKGEEERARLVEILEATTDYVAMTDPDGRVMYLNSAWRRLAGVGQKDAVNKPLIEFHPAAAQDLIRDVALPASLEDGLWSGETTVLGADAADIPVSQVIIGHRDAAGKLRFRSTIARDIRDRKAYEARIQHLANYDALTGLPNRSLLGDRAAQAIAQARRTGRTCGLIVLNIDRFKLLNDSYGHAAGDALLKQLAARVSGLMREVDTTARLGADVFAVLVVDLGRADDILVSARKIHECVGAPFPIEGRNVHVTLSIGASTYPRDGEDFELLLRNADSAMHGVKQAGGNWIQFYAAAMTKQATERIELEAALRNAIEQQRLELHYQPQVEIQSGRVIGVEALMRWKYNDQRYLSPALFVPVAEESGLIEPLGIWALMTACKQLAAWHRAGHTVRMAVNVSARQFRNERFPEAVDEALRTYGLQPGSLELELTESVLIEDRQKAIAILQRFKNLGVQIAVDDFGTGYSSLSYLSGLPIDCLKIDRAFVVQAIVGGPDAVIARAIISLGHALGLRVLAEGVETFDQLRFLREHECDECQGYLFARPHTADTVTAMLGQEALAPAEE
jgi:diguanylate cyclase (GGDEF)-like protein/PAS domain S-box-containing protein